ncbi:MAG: hypothetical protein ACLPX5_10990 [Dissulfurispiraceae bacterium]
MVKDLHWCLAQWRPDPNHKGRTALVGSSAAHKREGGRIFLEQIAFFLSRCPLKEVGEIQ